MLQREMRRFGMIGLFLLAGALTARANLTGLPLDYDVFYGGPPPTPNPTQQGGQFSVIKNTFGFAAPTWSADGLTLSLDNDFSAIQVKELYLEINYAAGTGPANAPQVSVTAALPPGVSGDPNIVQMPPLQGADDWTLHWFIFPQPDNEQFHFSVPSFFLLQQNVQSIEFGTYCHVPEPGLATMTLGAATIAASLKRRSRRQERAPR